MDYLEVESPSIRKLRHRETSDKWQETRQGQDQGLDQDKRGGKLGHYWDKTDTNKTKSL